MDTSFAGKRQAPFMTRWETRRYTDLLSSGKARQFSFVMEAKSVITYPSGDMVLKQNGFHEITGLAWSGRGWHITRVDVSADAGETWTTARLEHPIPAQSVDPVSGRHGGGMAGLQSFNPAVWMNPAIGNRQ